MSQTYDKTDQGAAFPPRENEHLLLSGSINNDGSDNRIIITMSVLEDGHKIRDIYQKVGTLYENDKEGKEGRPDYTGPIGNRRISAWAKQKGDMRYLSFSIKDKQQTNKNQGGNNAETRSKSVDDSIPF